MKHKLLIFLTLTFFFHLLPFNAHAQVWPWVRSATGAVGQEGFGIASDTAGNVLCLGNFAGPTVTFDSTVLHNVGGAWNMCVTKYDINGNLIWAKSAGWFDAGDIAYGINTDKKGNVLVSGYFGGKEFKFGHVILTNPDTSGNSADIFLLKYDSYGNILWARGAGSIGGGQGANGYSVCADFNGNIYMTGYFKGAKLDFKTDTLINRTKATDDFFLAKYDTNGNLLWVKRAGGISNDVGNSVCCDKWGNVFVTGYFQSDTIVFGNDTLFGPGDNVFIVKYDSTGNVIWAQSASGYGDPWGNGISIDPWGNAYVTGFFFAGSVTFGATTLVNSSPGYWDFFLAKYSSSGNPIWAKTAIGPKNSNGWSVCADNLGDIYCTGSFEDTATFGSIMITQPAVYYDPMYIVKYDSSGNVLCAAALGSGGDDQNAVCTDMYGNAYIEGDFYKDSIVVGNDTLFLSGGENLFTAKFNCEITTALDNIKTEPEINIYPNPARYEVTFESSSDLNDAHVEIYSVFGQLVQTFQLNQETTTISTNNLSRGVYLYRVCREDSVLKTGKIVLQ